MLRTGAIVLASTVLATGTALGVAGCGEDREGDVQFEDGGATGTATTGTAGTEPGGTETVETESPETETESPETETESPETETAETETTP
ncbi:MAG: hypothetical protein ICV69_07780 [Thermoleophilaceae bacterium]|nr:hypothetical protein [Thermoleophilaceae bacterium]